jgi:hypothetical protein
MNKDLPSSPNPFSQIWEKGSETFKVPLPSLGEGFRVRAKTRVLNLDDVYIAVVIYVKTMPIAQSLETTGFILSTG